MPNRARNATERPTKNEVTNKNVRGFLINWILQKFLIKSKYCSNVSQEENEFEDPGYELIGRIFLLDNLNSSKSWI